jgi:hypothetical protein
MKTSFAQFLSLRHGGSGFVFGYGYGDVGQNYAVHMTTDPPAAGTTAIPADRPFRSLSFPDIGYTLMRPAALPPSATYTDPVKNLTATNYAGDPGIRNPFLYAGYASATAGQPASTAASLILPPAIAPRRLFQPPDANIASNAGESGDNYLNNFKPGTASSATGALPFPTGSVINDQVVNFFWTPPTQPTLPTGVTVPAYLGNGVTPAAGTDYKEHPYFRNEMLQRAMNLTTVRTHQYAVWITIGFFEVKRQGDPPMAFSGFPTLAYDIFGPEIGASTGQTTRFRSFFIVDRLKLTAFDPGVVGSFRPAVVYRQNIE